MRANKRSGTKPEIAARTALKAKGLRFEVDVRGLPGTPDIVFRSAMVAVQVHGCFWHGCPTCLAAKHLDRRPADDYWSKKISANVSRDHRNREWISALGWIQVDVWEHEIGTDSFDAKIAFVADLVRARRIAKKYAKRYSGSQDAL